MLKILNNSLNGIVLGKNVVENLSKKSKIHGNRKDLNNESAKKAIDSIVKLSAKERLDYSIKTISGTETLYLLDGKDDWICLQDDEGKEYLMIFPESEFAELALQWNPQALRIDEMELKNFLEDTVPLMPESNIRLAIFPIDEKTETIIFDPIEFAKMINDYFYEWYGEEFDLPYLLGG